MATESDTYVTVDGDVLRPPKESTNEGLAGWWLAHPDDVGWGDWIEAGHWFAAEVARLRTENAQDVGRLMYVIQQLISTGNQLLGPAPPTSWGSAVGRAEDFMLELREPAVTAPEVTP